MREVTIGTHRYTQVVCMDEPGQGGACHEYEVVENTTVSSDTPTRQFAHVSFQNGPVKEFGVNGCFMEDLLAICIDRLRSFQAGSFACRENALALTKIEEAMHWLNHRTADRQSRGVEGVNEK